MPYICRRIYNEQINKMTQVNRHTEVKVGYQKQSTKVVTGRYIDSANNWSEQGTRIGGTARTNNVIRRAEQLAEIEAIFINQAERVNRAESQREGRRAKR